MSFLDPCVAFLDFAAVTLPVSLSGLVSKAVRQILYGPVASPIALWSNPMFSGVSTEALLELYNIEFSSGISNAFKRFNKPAVMIILMGDSCSLLHK